MKTESLIIFDIDGTLIKKGEFRISGVLVSNLQKLHDQSFRFSICTGRGLPGVLKVFEKNPEISYLFDLPIVLELGSKIFDPCKKINILECPLLCNEAEELIKQLSVGERVNISYWNKSNQRVLFTRNDQYFSQHKAVYGNVIRFKQLPEFLNSLKTGGATLLRVQTENPLNLENISTSLAIHPLSKNSGFEVTAAGISKSSGVKEVLTLLDFKPKKLFYFGNSERDRAAFAGIGCQGYMVEVNEDGNLSNTDALESICKFTS